MTPSLPLCVLAARVTLASGPAPLRMMLLVHVLAGAIGMVTGYLALYAAKGSALHRKSRIWFVYSMVTMSVFAAVIAAFEGKETWVGGLLPAYLVLRRCGAAARRASLKPRAGRRSRTCSTAPRVVRGARAGEQAPRAARAVHAARRVVRGGGQRDVPRRVGAALPGVGDGGSVHDRTAAHARGGESARAGAGVDVAWMFLGAGSMLFFVLFLRSRYLPGALARFGVFASALLVPMSVAMFVYPVHINTLKLFGVPFFFAEVATAFWLLFKGLQPRATAEARG